MNWKMPVQTEYVPPSDPKLAKSRRAPFFLRLSSTVLDISCGVLFSSVFHFIDIGNINLKTQVGILFYYIGTEILFGRSLGKILLGLDMVSTRGEQTTAKIIFRNILRGAAIMTLQWPFLAPILLMSWRRVSMLDTLSGMQVVRPEEFFKRKERRGKITPGFNEALLRR